jgi:2-polyprenyl-3-methyl-5-hydroxy-6-metoxy-1,4-benzoquinol methylase
MSQIHFAVPDYDSIVTIDIERKIKEVKYFNESRYGNLNIIETLKFYTNRYVKQLNYFTVITEDSLIADIGTGFGWLAIAFAFATKAHIIAVDSDKERLLSGKEIAGILGVGDRIDWRVGRLGNLPIESRKIDVVYCIEVLEHVYKSEAAIHDLCKISKDLLILTTPNLWFPIIAHDTQLPFCHWFPIPLRKIYAKLAHRTDRENDNLFWSPISLYKNTKEFERISDWLHYSSYKDFLNTFPFYLPYGKGDYVNHISKGKKIYYTIISKLGKASYILSPSLAGVFKRIK